MVNQRAWTIPGQKTRRKAWGFVTRENGEAYLGRQVMTHQEASTQQTAGTRAAGSPPLVAEKFYEKPGEGDAKS